MATKHFPKTTAARKKFLAAKRRKRLATLPRDFTKADMDYALEYFNNRCPICDCDLLVTGYHKDHWIPVASRLKQTANPGTVPWNILPMCPSCNNKKGRSQPLAWLTRAFGALAAQEMYDRIEEFFFSVRGGIR